MEFLAKVKPHLLTIAITTLATVNIYVFIKILGNLKTYTKKKQNLANYTKSVNEDLKLVRTWMIKENEYKNSKISREQYLVEQLSATLRPDEKIFHFTSVKN